jgi:hypothetical protein
LSDHRSRVSRSLTVVDPLSASRASDVAIALESMGVHSAALRVGPDAEPNNALQATCEDARSKRRRQGILVRKIYWSEKQIPALQGHSFVERNRIKRTVVWKVWAHWQVWSALLVAALVFGLYLVFAPRLPYPFFLGVALFFVVTRLLALPFNYFLAFHLSPTQHEP